MGFRGKQLGVALSGIVGIAAIVGTVYFAIARWGGAIGAPEAMADRLAFALRCDVFVLAWIILGVGWVANTRFFSPQDIDGAGLTDASPGIAVARAVLQNTLEQAVLAIGAHLALATLLPRGELVVIPALVALFCVGRAAFILGYRGGAAGRALGFVLTFYPTFLAYLWIVWRLARVWG